MGSFSIWHWLIVLLVVVLIFGTKKLRNLGGDVGGAVKSFKDAMNEEKNIPETAVDKSAVVAHSTAEVKAIEAAAAEVPVVAKAPAKKRAPAKKPAAAKTATAKSAAAKKETVKKAAVKPAAEKPKTAAKKPSTAKPKTPAAKKVES